MTKHSSEKRKIRELLDKTYTDSVRWNLKTLALKEGKTRCISFLNAHAVTMAYDRKDFSSSLIQFDYLLRDGVGVKIALSAFGHPKTENLNGTDLLPRILTHFSDKNIALWGATEDVMNTCKSKLKNASIENIFSLEHGFHDPDYYLELAQNTKQTIIVLCMGMPKQELLAKKLTEKSLCQLVICAGGWADFYSETKKRAPEWICKLSLEWVHRLIKEPKRLGKRYTFGVLYFFYVIIKVRLA